MYFNFVSWKHAARDNQLVYYFQALVRGQREIEVAYRFAFDLFTFWIHFIGI